MVKARDGHTATQHSLLGTGAVIAGVVLGIGVVYFNAQQDSQLIVQAATTACPKGNYGCKYGMPPPPGQQGPCMLDAPCTGSGGGAVCPGFCKGEGPGELFCKSDNTCNGEKLEGKPKEMPKEMGGMPPMLPMPPMKMPSMDMPMMPMPKEKDCVEGEKTVTTSTYATSTGTTTKTTKEKVPCPKQESGVSSYFNNLFGGGTGSVGSTIKSTVSTAADKLSSFIFGGTQGGNTQTEGGSASSTQAPSGSSAAQVGSQTVVEAKPITGVGGSAPSINTEVTGFGAQGTQTPAQQSGLLTAISQTLAGIGVTLRNLLSSWAF